MANIRSVVESLHKQQEMAYQNGDVETLALVGLILDETITDQYLDDTDWSPSRILPGVHWGSRDQRPYSSPGDSRPNTTIAL